MTLPVEHQTVSAAKITGLNDPILQELWNIKAKPNAQAHYSIDELVLRLQERQNQLQLQANTKKLH